MVISGLHNDQRKAVHILCEDLGLQHESRAVKLEGGGVDRVLNVYRPVGPWLGRNDDEGSKSKRGSLFLTATQLAQLPEFASCVFLDDLVQVKFVV